MYTNIPASNSLRTVLLSVIQAGLIEGLAMAAFLFVATGTVVGCSLPFWWLPPCYTDGCVDAVPCASLANA